MTETTSETPMVAVVLRRVGGVVLVQSGLPLDTTGSRLRELASEAWGVPAHSLQITIASAAMEDEEVLAAYVDESDTIDVLAVLVVDRIIAQLDSRHVDTRLRAMEALLRSPHCHPQVASAVTAKLTDPEPAVRRLAAQWMGSCSARGDRLALEALATRFVDRDLYYRRAAFEAAAKLAARGSAGRCGLSVSDKYLIFGRSGNLVEPFWRSSGRRLRDFQRLAARTIQWNRDFLRNSGEIGAGSGDHQQYRARGQEVVARSKPEGQDNDNDESEELLSDDDDDSINSDEPVSGLEPMRGNDDVDVQLVEFTFADESDFLSQLGFLQEQPPNEAEVARSQPTRTSQDLRLEPESEQAVGWVTETMRATTSETLLESAGRTEFLLATGLGGVPGAAPPPGGEAVGAAALLSAEVGGDAAAVRIELEEGPIPDMPPPPEPQRPDPPMPDLTTGVDAVAEGAAFEVVESQIPLTPPRALEAPQRQPTSRKTLVPKLIMPESPTPMDGLILFLSDDDAIVRAWAVEGIRLAAEAHDVRALVATMARIVHPDAGVRKSLLEGLLALLEGSRTPSTSSSLPRTDRDEEEKHEEGQGEGEGEGKGEGEEEPARKSSKESSQDCQGAAAGSGPPVPEKGKKLEWDDAFEGGEARRQRRRGKVSFRRRLAAAAARCTQDPSPTVRSTALQVLSECGDDIANEYILGIVYDTLEDPELAVRVAAAGALSRLAPVDDEAAIEAIANYLDEEDYCVRLRCGRWLRMVSHLDNPTTIAAISRRLGAPNKVSVRLAASKVLKEVTTTKSTQTTPLIRPVKCAKAV